MQASPTQGRNNEPSAWSMYPANDIKGHDYGAVQMLTCMVVL